MRLSNRKVQRSQWGAEGRKEAQRCRFGVNRTQTSNQTVLSGLLDPEKSIKPSIFRGVRRRLFASVHGVSVVNLWSVPGECRASLGLIPWSD
jgi:hypothetical protein